MALSKYLAEEIARYIDSRYTGDRQKPPALNGSIYGQVPDFPINIAVQDACENEVLMSFSATPMVGVCGLEIGSPHCFRRELCPNVIS